MIYKYRRLYFYNYIYNNYYIYIAIIDIGTELHNLGKEGKKTAQVGGPSFSE